MTDVKMAFNPLPWYLTAEGFRFDLVPPLPEMLRRVKDAGYTGIHAEVPFGTSAAEYRALLDDAGLQPAPGYFEAPLSDAEPASVHDVIEQAKRIAAQHAELGLDRMFLADGFGSAPARLATPAVGADADGARLACIAETVGRVAAAMVAEGVVPCLHQHVGTWIETEEEVEAVLAAVPARTLLFGPDTGHLAWAGADPVPLVLRHRDRVGAVHVKDIRLDSARDSLANGLDYMAAIGRRLWTEPARGDLDLDGVLTALGGFDGWYVVEVDVADQPTVDESARVAAAWLRSRLEEPAA